MKLDKLTFPVTPEMFVAYQAAGIGREPTDTEREILTTWVPVYNEIYAKGRVGDREALTRYIGRMDEFLTDKRDDPVMRRILESSKWWIAYAYAQGRRDAEEAET